jgi:hypothetical protein
VARVGRILERSLPGRAQQRSIGHLSVRQRFESNISQLTAATT